MPTFRLIHGIHCEKDPETGEDRIYYAGQEGKDTIETACELDKKFNRPGARRFYRISDEPLPESFQQDGQEDPPDVLASPDLPEDTFVEDPEEAPVEKPKRKVRRKKKTPHGAKAS